jgi:hypothetical protein
MGPIPFMNKKGPVRSHGLGPRILLCYTWRGQGLGFLNPGLDQSFELKYLGFFDKGGTQLYVKVARASWTYAQVSSTWWWASLGLFGKVLSFLDIGLNQPMLLKHEPMTLEDMQVWHGLLGLGHRLLRHRVELGQSLRTRWQTHKLGWSYIYIY